jgi:hypothetical protein
MIGINSVSRKADQRCPIRDRLRSSEGSVARGPRAAARRTSPRAGAMRRQGSRQIDGARRGVSRWQGRLFWDAHPESAAPPGARAVPPPKRPASLRSGGRGRGRLRRDGRLARRSSRPATGSRLCGLLARYGVLAVTKGGDEKSREAYRQHSVAEPWGRGRRPPNYGERKGARPKIRTALSEPFTAGGLRDCGRPRDPLSRPRR